MYISRRFVLLLFVGLALLGAIAYALLTLSFVRTPDRSKPRNATKAAAAPSSACGSLRLL